MNVASLVRQTAIALARERGSSMAIKAFPAFDGLRGYMAWWVVIGHALQLCGIENRWVQPLLQADIAVNVFVCLSGFVITHLLLEKRERYGAYLTRRAFRIFPIYWSCLACAIALSGAYSQTYFGEWVQGRDMRMLRETAVASEFNIYFALHVPMLHGVIPDTWLPYSSSAFLAPAWSLSLEWQFYIVAPILVMTIARGGWPRLMSLLIISAIWFYFKKASSLQWQYPAFLPLSLNFFVLGILSRIFMPALSRSGPWLLGGGILMAIVAPHSMRVAIVIWTIFLYSACMELRAATDLDLRLIGKRNPLHLLTSNQVIRYLGQFSYSTYLVHIPLFSLAGWLASLLMQEWTQQICFYSTVGAMLFLVPLSIVLYNFVEHPFIRFGSHIVQKKSAALKAT